MKTLTKSIKDINLQFAFTIIFLTERNAVDLTSNKIEAFM